MEPNSDGVFRDSDKIVGTAANGRHKYTENAIIATWH